MSELSENEKQGHQPPRRSRGGIAFPLLLIFAGVILLLNTTGVLPWRAWTRLWPLWPVALILIGLDFMLGHQSNLLRMLVGLLIVVALVSAGFYLVTTTDWENAAVSLKEAWPLQELEEGTIILRLGVGELFLEPLEDSNSFVQIRLEGAEETEFKRDFDQSGDSATLEISGPEWDSPWFFRQEGDIHWYIGLTDQIPLKLDIETGMGKGALDLRDLQVEDLELDTGVGEIEIILPAQVERGEVRIAAGIGKITVIVPEGVAARIEAEAGLGNVSVDQDKFPRTNGSYRSRNYQDARYQLEIEISGGIGEIEIRSE